MLSFCLMYPRLSTEEHSNLEMPVGDAKKKKISKESLVSLAKGPTKGQTSKTENFKTVTAQLQSNSTKKNAVHFHPCH